MVQMLAVRTPAPWLPCLRSATQLTRPASAISGGTHSSLRFGLRASSDSTNKPVSAKPTPMAGVPATEAGASTNASTAWNKPCAEKWTGGVHLILNCNLDAAWSLQSDFMGLSKWVPTISVSRLVEGEANAVGCLRYCKGSSTIWVHERLLEMDETKHYMSYRMEENHFVFPQGFQGYVAKVQLGEAGEGQTWVNWTYEVDPVISATREHVTQFMIGFYSGSLKFLEDGANKLVAENSEAAKSMTTSLSNVLPAQTAPVQAA